MTYRANTVRALDKKDNKYIVQFKDDYDEDGILNKLEFNFIKVGNTSGKTLTYSYDFQKLTLNNQPLPKYKSSGESNEIVLNKEDFKQEILKRFNQRIHLICPKEDCNDPNCRPQINLGNKVFTNQNTKQPYFSSHCSGINYGES